MGRSEIADELSPSLGLCDARWFFVLAVIARLGNPERHGEIQPLLVVHDETSRAASKLPLA